MKYLLKGIVVCLFVMAAGRVASAQSFIPFNPPPCDFNDLFYADNGIDSSSTSELNSEPDGRFGLFRKTGPPATGSQVNWVNDNTCRVKQPITDQSQDSTSRDDVRILATTGGNSDDDNSPFTCADLGNSISPGCAGQAQGIPETLEFISILAFLHAQPVFETNYSRTVGAIGPNGGLDNQQTNPGELISIGTFEGQPAPAANPRDITMEFIVSNFEAYASINQSANTLQCPPGATTASSCAPAPGNFAASPCSLGMIQNLQNPNATSLPQFCFNVADTKDANNNTVSDVASPKLRQNWRFATNRNAIDGSDGNCINLMDQVCKVHSGGAKVLKDSPFGYFCDDLLGMWVITYFWFTQPPAGPNTSATCASVFQNIGAKNGFTPEGFPNILTAHELNDELEANGCGAEGQEAVDGSDGGAAWLVCPALPDPRNGAIASDAFLDVVTHNASNAANNLDPFISNNFNCLQTTGKFCFDPAPEQ